MRLPRAPADDVQRLRHLIHRHLSPQRGHDVAAVCGEECHADPHARRERKHGADQHCAERDDEDPEVAPRLASIDDKSVRPRTRQHRQAGDSDAKREQEEGSAKDRSDGDRIR